jgi:hypothetical protein
LMSSWLLRTVLSVCTHRFQDMLTLPSWPVSPNFRTCSYQCSLSNFTPLSLHKLKCSWAHNLTCRIICIVLLPLLGMLMLCVPLSHQTVNIICICRLFLLVTFLTHDMLFVMSDLVQLLFSFQFLPSYLPSTATQTCLLH